MRKLHILKVASRALPKWSRSVAVMAVSLPLTALLACTAGDEANSKAEPQHKDSGAETAEAFTEAASPLPVDPCASKDCGEGTCSLADGKAVCTCKPGFGNLNGKDGTCVACKEVNGPLELNVPAASAMAVLMKDGQPVILPNPVTIRLGDNDRGLIADLNTDKKGVIPLGNYAASISSQLQYAVPDYETVPQTLSLGRVEVTADSKSFQFELPRVVQITGQLPVTPAAIVLSHESGAPFTVYQKRTQSKHPFGIETAADREGQFSFHGLPGKYRILQMQMTVREPVPGVVEDPFFQSIFARLRASGAEATPLAEFSAPQDNVTTPIAIDLPVHRVILNLSVNDGAIPCLDCVVDLYATNGQYKARIDPTTGQRSTVLPSGTYLAIVSGFAEPRPADPQVSRSVFVVEGGIHKIAHDQTIDMKVKLVKVSGKLLLNGETVTGKSVSNSLVVVSPSEDKASPATAHSPLSADGAYALWLPANVAHQWHVTLRIKTPASHFTHTAATPPLANDLSAFDFDLKTKKIAYKLVAPPGFVPTTISFKQRLGYWKEGKEGASELALGRYTTYLADNLDTRFSGSEFQDLGPFDVTDTTDAVEVKLSPTKISGKLRIGDEPIYRATFSSYGPGALESGITQKVRGNVRSATGDLADLWLLPGQYNLRQNYASSYLGCYIIKPQ